MNDWAAGACARSVIVEAVFFSALLFQIVQRVIIAVAVVSPSRAVPVVGA
jgi:hypothetical protein